MSAAWSRWLLPQLPLSAFKYCFGCLLAALHCICLVCNSCSCTAKTMSHSAAARPSVCLSISCGLFVCCMAHVSVRVCARFCSQLCDFFDFFFSFCFRFLLLHFKHVSAYCLPPAHESSINPTTIIITTVRYVHTANAIY